MPALSAGLSSFTSSILDPARRCLGIDVADHHAELGAAAVEHHEVRALGSYTRCSLPALSDVEGNASLRAEAGDCGHDCNQQAQAKHSEFDVLHK